MSISQGATDIIGGYPSAYGGVGGLGGVGLVGLIGLNSLWGNQWGNGNGFNGNGAIPGTTVLEQNVSELRKDVAETSINVERLGNEMQQAFATQTQGINADFRNLDNQICGVEKTLLQQSYAQSLQAFQNTQAIQNQINAFQTATDLQFCSVKQQINADGDATRALINGIEMQNLRDQLTAERRGRDAREIEINVTQTNQQTQNQIQAQLQSQNQFIASLVGGLSDQVNRANNSIVNLGGSITGAGQSNNQANTKVKA